MAEKVKLDGRANLLIELRRAKNRVEERSASSVRKDTREDYAACMQMICGTIDAIINACELGAACKVTVSLIQPHLPGLDDMDIVEIPSDDWYDDDGNPF